MSASAGDGRKALKSAIDLFLESTGVLNSKYFLAA
jgi:hypothetical protein